jgi:hypothetical protein
MTSLPALPATFDDVVALPRYVGVVARPPASGPGLRPARGAATVVRPAVPGVRGAH